MLRRIDRIQKAGIFTDYRWGSDIPEFERLTVIYGPNGTGKTSLARALYDSVKDPSSRSKLSLSFGTPDKSAVADNTHSAFDRIYVFSDAFVRENHRLSDNEATMPAIITLGDRSVEAEEEAADLTEQLPLLESKVGEAVSAENLAAKSLESLRKTVSGLVVDDLTKLSGEYQSRSKFSVKAVDRLYAGSRNGWTELNHAQYLQDRQAVVSSADDEIKGYGTLDVSVRVELSREAEALLSVTPASIVLDTLAKNPTAESWVREGVELHEHSNLCIFCGSEVTEERRRALDAHFSDAVERVAQEASVLVLELEQATGEIQDVLAKVPKRNEFSEDLRDDYDRELATYLATTGFLRDWIDDLAKRLRAKVRNVVGHVDIRPIEETPRMSSRGLDNLTDRHNKRVRDHEVLQKAAGTRILGHHLKMHAKGHDASVEAVRVSVEALGKAREKLRATQERIHDLLSVEGTVAPSAELLTKEVGRLLGRGELTFHTIGVDRYEIRRNDEPAHGLSEGERTAITLVHFLELVRKHDTKTKGMPIVIVDDPVSSLDQGIFIGVSSALWALVASKSSIISQLILLTHNFELFRQWDVQWDRFPNKRSRKNVNGFEFQSYELKSRFREGRRHSEIVVWPPSAAVRKKIRSGYHHSFIALADAHQRLIDDDSFERRLEAQLLFPNVIRSTLETFLAFKIPGQVGDLAKLMAATEKMLVEGGFEGDGDALRHNLLRYSNVYSHNESPQTERTLIPDEILAAIKSLFVFLNAVDRHHFEGMCEATGLTAADLLPTAQAVN
jgi:wobble nucleotide-excising tRNase